MYSPRLVQRVRGFRCCAAVGRLSCQHGSSRCASVLVQPERTCACNVQQNLVHISYLLAGKKKGGKACKKMSSTGDSNRVNLDMETLSVLGKMRLPVPSTVADIPGLVEKVTAKKEEYESKQKRKLQGEAVAEDADDNDDEDGGDTSNGVAGPDNGSHAPVNVSMRCDEAFGQVIVEIVAN